MFGCFNSNTGLQVLFSELRKAGRTGVEDLWGALSPFCPQATPEEVSEAESELYSGE